ncbi:hypothetical protein [Bifidobacterium callimiconis]|uniref:Uncharacterized protein n=1 Tax=Bifidobacterium callimiconis TaxID=2306973 RepID=A0A430FBZ6_9BIFI|nr:hypothetical protein [Bifidobacterium callimiconis]MBT1177691.1 hypothetical protein [Bifidobacterium callimiconis]RSX50366.1 hypothetical protein D2E23_1689 [Bifidobacterium callimiconis]
MSETKAPKPVQYGSVKVVPRDMRFSCLSGYNYYALTTDTVRVFGVSRQVVEHAQSGERFYLLPVEPPYESGSAEHHKVRVKVDANASDEEYEQATHEEYRTLQDDPYLAHWREIIYHPLPAARFEWPVDLVQSAQWHYLVFPMTDAGDAWHPLTELIDNINSERLTKREIAEMAGAADPMSLSVARSLLQGWHELLTSGYSYCGFTGGSVFYNVNDGSVRFAFSPAVHRVGDFRKHLRTPSALAWVPEDLVNRAGSFSSLDSSEQELLQITDRYPVWRGSRLNLDLDYVDVAGYDRIISALDKDEQPQLDVFSELFVIASVLFRLLVGRLPYDGGVMAAEPNGTGVVHEEWCKTYHRNADFIFDPKNEINHIGNGVTTPADDVFVRNWENLPGEVTVGTDGSVRGTGVKGAFVTVFTQGTERNADTKLRWCQPKTWLKRLEGYTAHPLD